MRIIARFGWCVLCLFLCLGRATAEGVHHFVFFNRDRERIADAAFLGSKAFAGAQLKYTWRELEHAGTVLLKEVTAIPQDLAQNRRFSEFSWFLYEPKGSGEGGFS